MNELYVEKNEYKELNNINPVGYSNNLKNNIILLIHENDKCLFYNISSNFNKFNLDLLLKKLKSNKNINSVDIYVSNNLDIVKLSIIKYIFNRLGIKYTINNLYLFNKEESIGYNYNLNEYYSVNIIDNVLTFRKK